MTSNSWTAVIAGVVLAGIALGAYVLLTGSRQPPGLVRRAEPVGAPESTASREERAATTGDATPRRSVATADQSASSLLDDLLFGSDLDARRAQIRLAGLHAAVAIDAESTIQEIVTRLVGDVRDVEHGHFQNSDTTAQVLVELSSTGVDSVVASWLAYRDLPTTALTHRRLRDLLADWPWSADQVRQIDELTKELLGIADAEALLARCRHLFGGSAAEREAVSRALDQMLANSRTDLAETILAAYVLYGDADRDLRALSVLFSRRQALSGQTELNPALMHAAQTLCLTMQGKKLGVGTPPPPTNRAQWLTALLAGTDAMTVATGSALLAAIGLAAAEDSPGALDAYGSLLDGTTNPLVRETIIVNLGRVATYEDLKRLTGTDLLTDPASDRRGEQIAYVSAILNLRQRHPHLTPRIARDVQGALDAWRRDDRLHDLYWRLLELLAFAPLAELTPVLQAFHDAGGDPYPDSLERALRACADARD